MIRSEPAIANDNRNGHLEGFDVPHRSHPTVNHIAHENGPIQPATRLGLDVDSLPPHPLGVKPLGNLYLSHGPTARASCGSLRLLPDEVILLLLDYLDAVELRRLGYCCKFMFAFSRLDELWKTLSLEAQLRTRSKVLPWQHSWRSTLLNLTREQEAVVDCSNVFSDVLHRPFVCSHISLGRYGSNIPSSNQIRRFESMTYDEFAEKWSDSPFILTDCVSSWPSYGAWTIDSLLQDYGDVSFRAEAIDWPFSTYHSYMKESTDESPLYLFDRKFAEKMAGNAKKNPHNGDTATWHESPVAAMYSPPRCFGPDLFALLGALQPAHRWLIAGPRGSGSTFHMDPNGTSAWNAVLEGAKYWIMFPSSSSSSSSSARSTPPGVYVSPDRSEVTSPLSIAEWLLSFHALARRAPGCVEAVCRAGEVLHVPAGWWHLVVNLSAGVALTQNFVPEPRLVDVLEFLRDRPEQVTGFDRGKVPDPYGLFVERLREERPELLESAVQELERKREERDGETSRARKRKWDAVVGNAEGQTERDGHSEAEEGRTRGADGGFSFGFGVDGGDEYEEEEDMLP